MIIRWIVAPDAQYTLGNGPKKDDYAFTTPGELLDVATGCGDSRCRDCADGFTGLSSRKATTIGVIAEVDMTDEEVASAICDSFARAFKIADDDKDMPGILRETTELVQEVAKRLEIPDVGSIVRSRHGSLYVFGGGSQ